jgi:hypothetical protein
MPDNIMPTRATTSPREAVAPGPPRTTAAKLDRLLHAWQRRFTADHSPSTVSFAFLDRLAHALNAPFQTTELGRDAIGHWQRFARIALGAETSRQDGSWWLTWDTWLESQSGRRIAPPPMGAALGAAPGDYVREH